MSCRVESRCAMAITVLPSIRVASDSWIAASTSGIEGRGRLVEHQDRRILDDHAGDGDALALAAGQLHAALAHMRLELAPSAPVGEPLDEVRRMGLARCRDHRLVAGLRPPVEDVLLDRAVQQGRVLRHHGDLRAQALLLDAGDVLAVDQDAPLLRLEEAQEQVDERGLADAGAADEADLLAGLMVRSRPSMTVSPSP